MKSCSTSDVSTSKQNIFWESDGKLGIFDPSTSTPIAMTRVITPGWMEMHHSGIGGKIEECYYSEMSKHVDRAGCIIKNCSA